MDWCSLTQNVSDCLTAEAEELKKTELMRLRHEARHDRKAHAMASRTKDNLKVFTGSDKTTASAEVQDEPVVDLKHLFTKHDRRVPHLPSEKIPDMLSAMKERQKQRKLAQEKAKKAAEAEAAKMVQQKLESERAESDHRHKKLLLDVSDKTHKTHHSSASSSVLPKPVSSDKGVKKVVKKSQPPPMSFEQLMVLAKQKQTEPIIDTQPVNVPKKVSAEQERPMTQEEKDRLKRRETKEYQDWLKYGGSAPPAPSGGKSQHQHRARESSNGQIMTVSSTKVPAYDASDDSDSETDETCNVQASKLDDIHVKSYSPPGTNRLKNGADVHRKQSPAATKTHSEKPFGSKTDSSQRSVERPGLFSRGGEILFAKDKVMSSAKGNDAGQNGKSKSLSDELIEKLKEERRKMVDSGDAVPSLADMLQDLLNKVRGSETTSQESTCKQSVPSGARSLKPSSSSTKSKQSISERKDERPSSVLEGSRSQSASGTRPSSQYVTVNETVVDCARDKTNPTRPVKPGDKRPMKSTWEEMYERSKSKNPNSDDRGSLHDLFMNCIYYQPCHISVDFQMWLFSSKVIWVSAAKHMYSVCANGYMQTTQFGMQFVSHVEQM